MVMGLTYGFWGIHTHHDYVYTSKRSAGRATKA